MKYILALFAVFLLLACSDAKPNRKMKQNGGALSSDANSCGALLSEWLAVDAKSSNPSHLGAALQCFKDNGYDVCNGVLPDDDDVCKTEMETFLASLGQRRQQRQLNALQNRERRSKSGRSPTGDDDDVDEDAIVDDCGPNPSLVGVFSGLLRAVLAAIQGAACDDDVFCIINTVLDVIMEQADTIDCLVTIQGELRALS